MAGVGGNKRRKVDLSCPISGCKRKFSSHSKLGTHCQRVHDLILDDKRRPCYTVKVPNTPHCQELHEGKDDFMRSDDTFRLREGLPPCIPPSYSSAFLETRPEKLNRILISKGQICQSNYFDEKDFFGTNGMIPSSVFKFKVCPASRGMKRMPFRLGTYLQPTPKLLGIPSKPPNPPPASQYNEANMIDTAARNFRLNCHQLRDKNGKGS